MKKALFRNCNIILKVIITIITLFAGLDIDLAAQPISPVYTYELREFSCVGGYLGFGQAYGKGNYNSSQCNCSFYDGVGFSFNAGVFYEKEFIDDVYYTLDFGVNYYGIETSYKAWEQFDVTSPRTDRSEYVQTLMRQKSKFDFFFLSFLPGVKYSPFNFLFVRTSIGISYLASGEITHDKELLTSSVVLQSGEQLDLKFGNGTKVNSIEKGKINGVASFVFSVIPAIGLNIPFGTNLTISPVLMFDVPLQNVIGSPSDYKVGNWQIRLEGRYFLSLRKK